MTIGHSNVDDMGWLVDIIKFVIIAFVLYIIAAFLFGNAIQDIFTEIAYSVSNDLPFTNHAYSSHAGQTWNASTIYDYMKSGKCNYDSCFIDDTELRFCKINDKYSILLFVGKTIKQIITGYMIETVRLDKKLDGKCER